MCNNSQASDCKVESISPSGTHNANEDNDGRRCTPIGIGNVQALLPFLVHSPSNTTGRIKMRDIKPDENENSWFESGAHERASLLVLTLLMPAFVYTTTTFSLSIAGKNNGPFATLLLLLLFFSFILQSYSHFFFCFFFFFYFATI